MLSVEDGRVSLAEGSDGGTWLVRGGHRYSISVPVELMAGDRVVVGETDLAYEDLLRRGGIATPPSPAQRVAEPRTAGSRVLRVGRSRDGEIVLDDASVADLHAILEVEPEGRIHLRDLPGTTGVVLVRDGRRVRVKDQVVLLTDVLEFGAVTLTVGEVVRRAVAVSSHGAAPAADQTLLTAAQETHPSLDPPLAASASGAVGPPLAGLVLVLALVVPWPGATWPVRLLLGGLVGALVLWLATPPRR